MMFRSDIPTAADELAREVEAAVVAATTRAMKKTAMVGEARVKTIMQKEAYDTGRLLRSVTSAIQRYPDLMTLTIGSNLEYALAVEYGRKPGKWPNLDALVKWTGRKLRQKGVNTRVNVTFDQLKALAKAAPRGSKQKEAFREHLSMLYLVGRKIATKGIRQKLIFKRIESALLTYFQRELQAELDRV